MTRRNRQGAAAVCLAVVLAVAAAARAWHGKGHHVATTLAVEAARPAIPTFFVAGAARVAHGSLDPDNFTRPIAPKPLHSSESPEHYVDLELLKGAEFPPTRYEFLALCYRKELNPRKVGLLPYAVVEWTQRLTVALAEHRAYPDNPHIRSKCLTFAGMLSHYAQDLCQPLHTTIHYDGRAKEDNSSPRTGIHVKVDALLGKLECDRRAVLAGPKVQPFEKLMPAVLAEIRRTHALVDRVYGLADEIPALDARLAKGSPVERFTAERLRAAARFSAALYLTAWRDSAKIELPEWYKRPYHSPPAAKAQTKPSASVPKLPRPK